MLRALEIFKKQDEFLTRAVFAIGTQLDQLEETSKEWSLLFWIWNFVRSFWIGEVPRQVFINLPSELVLENPDPELILQTVLANLRITDSSEQVDVCIACFRAASPVLFASTLVLIFVITSFVVCKTVGMNCLTMAKIWLVTLSGAWTVYLSWFVSFWDTVYL